MIEQLMPLFYFIAGGSFLVAFYKIRSSKKKDELKVQQKLEKQKEQNSLLDGIDGFIKNAPMVVEQMEKLKAEQAAKGATAEQLAPLDEKIKLAKLAVQYGDIWNVAGKQIASFVMPLIKSKLGLR